VDAGDQRGRDVDDQLAVKGENELEAALAVGTRIAEVTSDQPAGIVRAALA
jgi:hypothetical protein